MKRLIIAALLAISASLAHANQEFSMPNQAGGEIRLTTTRCPDKGRESWFIMYSYVPSGTSIYGCWFANNGLVHVSWVDGTSSIFKATSFRPINGGGI